MARRKRSDADYVQSAKQLSTYFPALKKYRRRKRLNRGEKALIARAENSWQSVKQFSNNVQPLSERQAKSLKNKDALIGSTGPGSPNIRAVYTPPRARARVDKGRLVFDRPEGERTRTTLLEPINWTENRDDLIPAIMDAMARLRRRLNQGRRRQNRQDTVIFSLWQAMGVTQPSRVTAGPDDEEFAREVAGVVEAYMLDAHEQARFPLLLGIGGRFA